MRSTKDVMEAINKESWEVRGYHDVDDGFIGVDDDGHCVYNSLLREELNNDEEAVFVDVYIDQTRAIGKLDDGNEVISISKIIDERFGQDDKSLDSLNAIINKVRQEYSYYCLVWTHAEPEVLSIH